MTQKGWCQAAGLCYVAGIVAYHITLGMLLAVACLAMAEKAIDA